jgi:ribonuclease-3
MARRKPLDLTQLEQAIGYTFQDRTLLERALTHVSALSSQEGRTSSYQRLEFLGDRVLGLVISALLVKTFPDAGEGELSRRLADLVRKETCTEVSQVWNVGPFLRMGSGEVHAGGRRNAAILADTTESMIGAVFLDGGFEAVEKVVIRAFEPRMHAPTRPLRDAKTTLQEWAQAQGLVPPSYTIIDRTGPDHAPCFTIEVKVGDFSPLQAQGTSRRYAEQAAAEHFLKREGAWETSEHSHQDKSKSL